MNKQIKEQLSAFMDGELQDENLISHLQSDSETRETWARYHMIRDALHQGYVAGAHIIADRVAKALEDEPIVLAPKRWYHPKQLGKQVAGLAVAATVAGIAIMVVRESPQPVQDAQQLATGPITTKPVRMTAAAERKLSGYIVSHNEFSASTSMKGMLVYTPIVSATPVQSLAQRVSVNVKK